MFTGGSLTSPDLKSVLSVRMITTVHRIKMWHYPHLLTHEPVGAEKKFSLRVSVAIWVMLSFSGWLGIGVYAWQAASRSF